MRPTAIISACLLGIPCRYDGRSKLASEAERLSRYYHLVPVCPEQLGGLPTPRLPAEIICGDGIDVLSKKAGITNLHGEEVTSFFLKGAYLSIKIANICNANKCFLKSKSPSCGLSPKIGVTAALFLRNNFSVEELD